MHDVHCGSRDDLPRDAIEGKVVSLYNPKKKMHVVCANMEIVANPCDGAETSNWPCAYRLARHILRPLPSHLAND